MSVALAATALATILAGAAARRTASRLELGALARARPALAVGTALALLAAAAPIAVAVVLAGREPARRPAAVPPGSTVTVLDVSGSVATLDARKVDVGLAAAARGVSGRTGLVVFADEAATVLPPTASAADVRRAMRFFGPPQARGATGAAVTDAAALVGDRRYATATPWRDHFPGGTSISSGVRLATGLLARSSTGPKRILLVSDLADGEVREALKAAMRAARVANVEVVVLPLDAQSADIARFRGLGARILDPHASRPQPAGADPVAPAPPLGVAGGKGLLTAAVGLPLVLAVLVLGLCPLRFRARRERRP